MPKRRKRSRNTDPESKVYSFRLNRKYKEQARTRELIDFWLSQEMQKPKEDAGELADIICALSLKHAGELDKFAIWRGRLVSLDDIREMLGDILREIRQRDPDSIVRFATQSPIEGEALEQDFIDNLLEGFN